LGFIGLGICKSDCTDFKSFSPLPVSKTTFLDFSSNLFSLKYFKNPAKDVAAAGSENIPVFLLKTS